MTLKLRALSVTQPYATNIILDDKDVENRGWEPRGVAYPFWMAIHATREDTGLRHERYPLSCIMGVVRVAKVLRPNTQEAAERCYVDRWALRGSYLWVMDRKLPIVNPVSCKGKLGLWWVEGELLERIVAELGENAREVV